MARAPDNAKQAFERLRRNHQTVSYTAIHGRGAFLFGLAFFAMGAFIVLITTGIIPTKEGPPDGPLGLKIVCGAIFATPGLWLMLMSLGDMRRKRWSESRREQFPTEPWQYDHPWNDNGTRDRRRNRVLTSAFGVLVVGLLATPLNYIAIEEGGAPSAFFLCANIIVVPFVIIFLVHLARWLRHGTPRLTFGRFPYRLGDTLSVELQTRGALNNCESLTSTLRYIEEAYVTYTDERGQRTSRVDANVRYEDAKEIPLDADPRGGRTPIAIEFKLPDGDFDTTLAERPPKYWELEITGKRKGPDFNASFLLPIYAKARHRQPSHDPRANRPAPSTAVKPPSKEKALAAIAGVIATRSDPNEPEA